MWGDVSSQRGAKAFGWDKRHPTGDATPGPIKTGMGVRGQHRGAAAAAARRRTATSSSDGSVVVKCGTQDLGTGTRTIVAMVAAETLGLPVSAVKAGNRRHDVSVQRRVGRQHDGRVGQPAIRVAAVKALDALFAKVAPALGVDAGDAGRRRRPHPRQGQRRRRAWRGRTPASCSAPSRSRSTGKWQPGLSSRHERRAVRRSRRSTSRPASSRSRAILAIQDCGLIVDKLHGREPGLRRHHRVAQLRAVRGSHPRSQHRPDGQPEHGVVPAGRHVRRAEDRHHADRISPSAASIGIGEPPTVSTASAIANAVRNATGVDDSQPAAARRTRCCRRYRAAEKAGGTL